MQGERSEVEPEERVPRASPALWVRKVFSSNPEAANEETRVLAVSHPEQQPYDEDWVTGIKI